MRKRMCEGEEKGWRGEGDAVPALREGVFGWTEYLTKGVATRTIKNNTSNPDPDIRRINNTLPSRCNAPLNTRTDQAVGVPDLFVLHTERSPLLPSTYSSPSPVDAPVPPPAPSLAR